VDFSAAQPFAFPVIFLEISPQETPSTTHQDTRSASNMAAQAYVLNRKPFRTLKSILKRRGSKLELNNSRSAINDE
jgi:hypothetical protein